jgi:hypothetical protein
MMHGRGESDPVIVALNAANKAEPSLASVAEPLEPRAGAKGNASQHHTQRTQSRVSVPPGLERIRRAADSRLAVTHPRWEPYAGKPHVRICAGGAQQ